MSKNDPAKGRIVIARAPRHGMDVRLGVHHKTTRTLATSGRLASLGEYVGLIHKDGVLEDPVAIFQGLNRPYFGTSIDGSVHVYVATPPVSYTFTGVSAHSGQGPLPIPAPRNSVFAMFVTFAKDVVDDVQGTFASPADTIGGVILYWEWTMADSSAPDLPDGHQTRYRRMVWRRT